MSFPWRNVLMVAAAAVAWPGCGTGPPGAGLTNGEPTVIGGAEKPAVRDDMPVPDSPGGDEALAEGATLSPGSAGNNAGTGGRGGGQGGGQAADAARSAPAAGASQPRPSPPTIEAPAENGAQGGTKPPGNINTGTPRSPQ